MKKNFFSLLVVASSLLSLNLFGEQTLSLIKPDAVKKQHIGAIIKRFEEANISINALKMTKLSPEKASQFYAEHKGKPFFNDLIAFMTSGPIVAIVLEGEDVVAKNRQMMGATDPTKAHPRTLRADFASSTTYNAVHGSDSVENAKKEIAFFFQPSEIYSSSP